MNRVRFVTFPRSGHHWLVSMIQKRLPEMRYDEHHETGRTLENFADINAQKTHDFDLSVPKRDDVIHVVQIRRMQDAIASWDKIMPRSQWLEKEAFYGAFVSKWIVEPVPNRIVVKYEELLNQTESVVEKVVSHIKK